MLRSLSGLVQQTIGRKVVVDFKDESSAEGIIESCDESMNITLTEVKYFKRRLGHTGEPVCLDSFFARGCYIRFVHFEFRDTSNIKSLINRTAKEEEKPRTRRVFGQAKLPNAFGHIKIQKHLSDSLNYYEAIYPRIRSLNSTISPYSMHFSFKAFNQTFILILRESDKIPAASTNFRLVDGFGKDKSDQLLSSFTYYEGFLSDCPHTAVSLTVSKTNVEIMGRIDTDNETFYIEKLLNETVIYRASDVQIDLSAFGPRGHTMYVPECAAKRPFFEDLTRSKRAINRRPVKKNRCEMKLVADYEFYKVIGNGNYYSAANYLINVIERVNKIFTSVDWGINFYGDKLINIGFLIKEIKIYNYPTPKGHYFHFNNEYAQSGSSHFSVNNLIMSFSEEEGSNASCVTILVTAKVMEGVQGQGILGLAHVGNTKATLGICANKPHNDFYSNTAVVTVMKKEGLMITRIFDLVFTHGMY
uniref:Sm domain-containing protein n=1 Tax=Panagrolaimus superbus TaxID=310955 RepID=A0A914YWC0_9BILA